MAARRMLGNCCYCLNRHFLLIGWIILNLVVFSLSYYHYLINLEYFYLRKTLGHGLCVSRGSAAVLSLSCSLVLLPVCRMFNSTLHRILGRYSRFFLTCWFTNLKIIHISIASTIVIFSLIHSCGHIVNALNFSYYFNENYPEINWASFKGESPALLILTSVVGVTGVLMLFLLILMVLLSTSYVRKLDYDLFWGSHFLFVIFLILYFIHPLKGVLTKQTNTVDHFPGCKMKLNNHSTDVVKLHNSSEHNVFSNEVLSMNFVDFDGNYSFDNNVDNACTAAPVFTHMKSQSWIWVAGSLLVYLIDIAFRICNRNYDGVFVIKSVKMLPGDVVDFKIRSVSSQNIPSPSSTTLLNHNTPSQYILIQCPKISPLEWHPFTVVNSFKDKKGYVNINLLIKMKGDWTRSVYNSAFYSVLHGMKSVRLLVDGPFFSPIQNIVNSTIVICIAAGIGITPFAAVLHHIIKEDIRKMCQPFIIHLVWVIRSVDQLVWIQDLLIKLHKKLSIQNHLQRFNLILFVTKGCKEEPLQGTLLKIFEMANVYVHYGKRPNWLLLLSDWKKFYERGTVKVFLSGPPDFITEIDNLCHKLNTSSNGCHLKCIKEPFC